MNSKSLFPSTLASLQTLPLGKKIFKYHKIFLIAGLLLVATILRVAWIQQAPLGFNWDEAAHAYNAWSLLETGKDEYGHAWPLFLQSFNDYKSAFFAYLLIPVFAITGPQEAAARITIALSGVLGIAAVIGLFQRWKLSPSFALLAGAWLTFLPWHIHYSRMAIEPLLAFTGILVGWYLWFGKRPISFWGALLAWSAGLYAYHSARLFLPLSFIALAPFFGRQWLPEAKQRFLPLLLTGLTIAFFFYQSSFGMGGERARDLFFFTPEKSHAEVLDRMFRSSVVTGNTLRPWNNKAILFGHQFLEQYAQHFDVNFLFFRGNLSSRHGFMHHGNFLPIMAPFIAFGMFRSLQRRQAADLASWTWLFLAPLPSALSADMPHSGRALFMILPLLYFLTEGTLGFWQVLQSQKPLWRWSFLTIAALAVLGNISLYAIDYALYFPEESSVDWQYPLKEASVIAFQAKDSYQTVSFADDYNNHYIFYAWVNRISPTQMQQYQAARPEKNAFGNVDLAVISRGRFFCLLNEPQQLIITTHTDPFIPAQKIIRQFHRFYEDEGWYFVYESDKTPESERVRIAATCQQWKIAEGK